MNDFKFDDEDGDEIEGIFYITEDFCKKYDLPFNKTAAEKAAMNDSELYAEMKKMDMDGESDEKIEDALIYLLKDKYLKALKCYLN